MLTETQWTEPRCGPSLGRGRRGFMTILMANRKHFFSNLEINISSWRINTINSLFLKYYRQDPARGLIGRKPMFYHSIKSVLQCFAPHYLYIIISAKDKA